MMAACALVLAFCGSAVALPAGVGTEGLDSVKNELLKALNDPLGKGESSSPKLDLSGISAASSASLLGTPSSTSAILDSFKADLAAATPAKSDSFADLVKAEMGKSQLRASSSPTLDTLSTSSSSSSAVDSISALKVPSLSASLSTPTLDSLSAKISSPVLDVSSSSPTLSLDSSKVSSSSSSTPALDALKASIAGSG